MVEVLRPGIYRAELAGMLWVLLRLEGCMGPKEAAERLQQIGLDVGRGKVNDTLKRYTGRLFQRVRKGRYIVYCAVEVG